MFTLLAILIFLLYYCLFYVNYDRRVEKPNGVEYDFSMAVRRIRDYDYLYDGSKRKIIMSDHDGRMHFFDIRQADFPYTIKNRKAIVQRDACANVGEGEKTAATGRELYEYVRKRSLVDHRSETLLKHVQRVIQQGQLFYFQCSGGHVQSLHICDGGTALVDDRCVPVDDCLDRERGATFANPSGGKDHFYLCDSQSERKKCPPGTYFIHDSCRRLKAIDAMCRDQPLTFFALDSRTYIRCDARGHAKKYHCPPGQVLFGEKCEVDWCVGKPEGSRVNLPEEKYENLFSFFPGYAICGRNGSVSRQVRCGYRNPLDLTVEDLSALPMVFDGRDCVTPSLCANVTPVDDTVVVPLQEYRNRLGPNWSSARVFDESAGYVCDQRGVKRRVTCDLGQRIKKFKFASACDDDPSAKVVIGDVVDRFYDCATRSTQLCPNDHFFNGTECQRKIPRSHQYRGIDVFRLNNLSEADDWILPWNYSNDPSPFKNPPDKLECTDPESHYIHGYNVCAHPDCSVFGYLKQFESFVMLPDGHLCHYFDNRIVKTPKPVLKSGYRFWSQRGEFTLQQRNEPPPVPAQEDPCIFGQHIQSGNFFMDSVLYATCDTAQPFVFCPSASTTGIVAIDGKNHTKQYACAPPNPGLGSMKPGESRHFQKNELERVVALKAPTNLLVDNTSMEILNSVGEAYEVQGKSVDIMTDEYVRLEYKYTVTYPPNAYYEGMDLKGGTAKDSFILKRADFSDKPMLLPEHKIENSVDGFKLLLKNK